MHLHLIAFACHFMGKADCKSGLRGQQHYVWGRDFQQG